MKYDFDNLRSEFANHIVDGMDIDALITFAYEKILENLEDMHEVELLEQVEEFAPHLLDDEVTE
jgi:hypothetical protein